MPSVFMMRKRATAVSLVDTFNRADSLTTLDPPSDGIGSWLIQSGTGGGTLAFGISSNRAVWRSGTADPKATRDPGDYETMTYSLKVMHSNGTIPVFFGYSDNVNHYKVTVDTSGPITLTRVRSGTATTLGTGSLPFWFGEEHTVTITHNRVTNAIVVKWDGVTKITYTDGSPLTGTRCGFELNTSSSGRYVADYSVTVT